MLSEIVLKPLFKNTYFFISVVTVCLMIAMLFSFADDSLVYSSLNSHQIWRLVSAHVVHTDVYHLTGNLLAFALLLYLFPLSWQKQIQVFVVAVVLIDVYLIVFSIEIYAGLSGLIYAIPGARFFQLLKQKQYKSALMIVSILILYVFVISPQTNEFNSSNWQPLKSAHLLGFLAGYWGVSKNNFKAIRHE